jgi:regulator of ribonuclease activity A
MSSNVSSNLIKFATTDICDANEDLITQRVLRVVAPLFKSYGGLDKFQGSAVTLKVFEDNTWVRTLLDEPGQGRVLVIDGGGSLRCALVGGNLGVLAEKNGWAGILVNGCVRDTQELQSSKVGIRALAAHPQKSVKRNIGERDLIIDMAGTVVKPGDRIYVDEDGILVSDKPLI